MKFIIYSGKAKDYPGYKYLLWAVFMNPENTKPLYKLESGDYNLVLN